MNPHSPSRPSVPEIDAEDAMSLQRYREREAQRLADEQREREQDEAETAKLMAAYNERQWREAEEQASSRERERVAREERRQRFTAQKDAQAALQIPTLETTVLTLTTALVECVVAFGRCGLLTGAPGVGKSRALHEIAQRGRDGRGRDAAVVELSATDGNSVKAVLEAVCAHVGVEPASSNADTERRLCKQVDYAPVLLFDEAQNLTLAPLRVLLGLSEKIGIPMVFCGNHEVLQRVSSKQAAMQQISRRLPFREEIPCIADSDVDLIADHFGLVDAEARRLCHAIGAMFHADGVAGVLARARRDLPLGASLCAEHVRGAIDCMPQFRAALARKHSHPGFPMRRSSVTPLIGPRA